MIQYAQLALSAVEAISSISQGYSEKKESEYNASLLGEKAAMLDIRKNIEFGQYERLKGQTYGKSMVNIGAMGIRPSGSAMAAVLNAQNQITIDQILSKFNTDQEKRYTLAEQQAELRAGKRAVTQGYTRAFSSLLSGGIKFAKYKKGK